jgi:hypothetical protein
MQHYVDMNNEELQQDEDELEFGELPLPRVKLAAGCASEGRR